MCATVTTRLPPCCLARKMGNWLLHAGLRFAVDALGYPRRKALYSIYVRVCGKLILRLLVVFFATLFFFHFGDARLFWAGEGGGVPFHPDWNFVVKRILVGDVL